MDLALEFGRLAMESGGSAREVEAISERVAKSLGAEQVEVRLGYASFTITATRAVEAVSRMRKLHALGVNQRLYQNILDISHSIERDGLSLPETREQLAAASTNPRHPNWLIALAVGIACAAFGRLLDVDRMAVIPIFAAAVIGQYVRSQLAVRKVNVFLSTAFVAFGASLIAGLGARLADSQTVARDMIVSVLLLIPGVPAFNAQFDILEGRPTLGSARAVWVAVVLVFMTAGVWLARGVLGEGH